MDFTVKKRRSIRLPGYNYSWPGQYFVTLCVQNGELLLDQDPVKNMIVKVWRDVPNKFKNVKLDEFVIMPNHLHGIVIVGADLCVCPNSSEPREGAHAGAPLQTKLGRIVQWFKTMTTNEYLRRIKNSGWPPFPGRLWQRNYYEHIIRNPVELKNIRRYIRFNPNNWDSDPENPAIR